MHKHAPYIKMFFLLFSGTLVLLVICYWDEEPPPLCHNQVECIYLGHFKEEIFCEELEKFELISLFGYQLSGMSAFSLLVVLLIMFYTWEVMKEDENDEMEKRLMKAATSMAFIEALVSFVFFYQIRTKCNGNHAQQSILIAMGVLNAWGTIVERGYNIVGKLYHDYQLMSGILDNLQVLDEDDLEDFEDEPECAICEDDVDEDGRLTKCGHLFHSYCIKEWITEYGAICPECNATLEQAKPPLMVTVAEDDDVEEEDTGVPPAMLFKIVEEMEKFDNKTSFFSELADIEKKQEEDEEEEESDYYD